MYSNINKIVEPLRESIKVGLSYSCEYRYKKILKRHVDTFWTCVEENMIDDFDDSLEFYSLDDISECFEAIMESIVEDNEDFKFYNKKSEWAEISEDGDIMPFASIQKVADLFSDFLTYHYSQEHLKN